MPFLTFQVSVEEALRNAGRVLKETGVQSVKVEGGDTHTCEVVSAMVTAGIPVMGHLGLTPQSVHALGGYRVQGREADVAERLRREAHALEEAGVYAIVLELLPAELAAAISKELTVPTIGIGAGAGCDGQVLVLYDALGLNVTFQPKFLLRFAELHDAARQGVNRYLDAVRSGRYPDSAHSFTSSE
jgi:3-methyl-2-oxobutanoate hydroxymethyltransferase